MKNLYCILSTAIALTFSSAATNAAPRAPLPNYAGDTSKLTRTCLSDDREADAVGVDVGGSPIVAEGCPSIGGYYIDGANVISFRKNLRYVYRAGYLPGGAALNNLYMFRAETGPVLPLGGIQAPGVAGCLVGNVQLPNFKEGKRYDFPIVGSRLLSRYGISMNASNLVTDPDLGIRLTVRAQSADRSVSLPLPKNGLYLTVSRVGQSNYSVNPIRFPNFNRFVLDPQRIRNLNNLDLFFDSPFYKGDLRYSIQVDIYDKTAVNQAILKQTGELVPLKGKTSRAIPPLCQY